MDAKLVDSGEQLWIDTGVNSLAEVNRLRVVVKSGRFLATKRAGRHCWAGIGQRRFYVPASFELFECSDPGDPHDPDAPWSHRLSIPMRS